MSAKYRQNTKTCINYSPNEPRDAWTHETFITQLFYDILSAFNCCLRQTFTECKQLIKLLKTFNLILDQMIVNLTCQFAATEFCKFREFKDKQQNASNTLSFCHNLRVFIEIFWKHECYHSVRVFPHNCREAFSFAYFYILVGKLSYDCCHNFLIACIILHEPLEEKTESHF